MMEKMDKNVPLLIRHNLLEQEWSWSISKENKIERKDVL